MMASKSARPLSPHLTVWKWGAHMTVSILHRISGSALASVAVVTFLWWLYAAASGPDAYACFHSYVIAARDGDAGAPIANILFLLAAIGLTWVIFQHIASGVRHLFLDMGAGYELKTNKAGSMAVLTLPALLTALIWGSILLTKGQG
jgi:succinate dehydrogenase / fumarate reductase cytochrome b subunit